MSPGVIRLVGTEKYHLYRPLGQGGASRRRNCNLLQGNPSENGRPKSWGIQVGSSRNTAAVYRLDLRMGASTDSGGGNRLFNALILILPCSFWYEAAIENSH